MGHIYFKQFLFTQGNLNNMLLIMKFWCILM